MNTTAKAAEMQSFAEQAVGLLMGLCAQQKNGMKALRKELIECGNKSDIDALVGVGPSCFSGDCVDLARVFLDAARVCGDEVAP